MNSWQNRGSVDRLSPTKKRGLFLKVDHFLEKFLWSDKVIPFDLNCPALMTFDIPLINNKVMNLELVSHVNRLSIVKEKFPEV